MVFVPATPPCSYPVELLASESMRRLVREASKKFQLVILDSAPVIPVADALVLAALADTTLLAVRWGKTARSLVAAALKNLAAVGKPVTAAAFSHVNLRQYAAYAYGYYPVEYGSPTEADPDGESDPAPQTVSPAVQGWMTRSSAVWQAISAASARPVVPVLIIALILSAYALYANILHTYSGRVDAEQADIAGPDQSRTVAHLAEQPHASTDGAPVVAAPGPALAQDAEPSIGPPPASEPSQRPSPPLVVPADAQRQVMLDGTRPDMSEGSALSLGLPPADEASKPPSPPLVAPDVQQQAMPANSPAQEVGDVNGGPLRMPEDSGSSVGSPPSARELQQPLPAEATGAPPSSEVSYRIQLASYHRQADAEKAWGVFSADLGEVLSGLRPNVESAETSGGVFYRLQAGPLETAEAAGAICERVRQHGTDCLVVRRNGV